MDKKSIGKALTFVLAAMLAFWGTYTFLDGALHYRVGNWFERTFFKNLGYANLSQGLTEVHDFIWPKFKIFLLLFGIVASCIWAITMIIATAYARRHSKKETVKEIGQLLRQHFTQEGSIFPEEYQDIADYAVMLKEQMKQNEQVLREESNRKNDLIAYLAHDLKTPLTSVIGYLSLLKEAPDMPMEQRAKYTGIALEKALRLENLINEFFDIARYNLHEIVLEEETFDLGYMLMQMADEFYPLLEQRGKSIVIHDDGDLTISADSAKLARVFNNILKNAVAYSYDNTEIEIYAGKQGNTIYVSISNFGKTIPKQKLDVIFEKFYRLDDARSTNTGGAGLGLAIAKEIVVAHGGSINVTSEKQITSFTVELPAQRE